MNSIVKILLVFITIVTTNSAFAIDKSAINLEDEPITYNTEKNIQQAKFIEDEVVLFKDLKNINNITKEHLRTVKNTFISKKQKYDQLASKLSISLDRIINGLSLYYSKQTYIDTRWKKILLELKFLQTKSKQLKSFGAIDFKNITETKSALIRILKSVKVSILKIKAASKEK